MFGREFREEMREDLIRRVLQIAQNPFFKGGLVVFIVEK